MTKLGREIFSRVERMEEALLEIQGFATQGQVVCGRVTIASMKDVGSMPISRSMKSITGVHPDIDVHLVTTSTYVDLPRRDADISVSFFAPAAASVAWREVTDVPFRLYASEAYLRGRSIDTPEDLAEDFFIGYIDDPIYLPSTQWLRISSRRPGSASGRPAWSRICLPQRKGSASSYFPPMRRPKPGD